MKFPSFLKIPRHQRFNFEPRYYDPVKEELEQRISRIRKEVEDNANPQDDGDYKARISGSFQRRTFSRRPKAGAGLMQFIIMIILFGGFVGYLYYGNTALYLLILLLVLYVYLKARRII